MSSKNNLKKKISTKKKTALSDGIKDLEKTRNAIDKWIDDDLARSGINRDDMKVELFMPERKRNGAHKSNGGYKIHYPDPIAGEDMKGSNGRKFLRKRFMPPLPEGKDGRRKYETAYGAGNRCFILPDVHKYLTDFDKEPMYLTEGEKKAAKATKEGLPMIGLTGIWGWLESKSVREKNGEDYAIHSDLLQYLKTPRDVYMIYDSDAKDTPEKVRSFNNNIERLAVELADFNCKLFRVDMPPSDNGEKQGIDDYLLKRSASELKEYIKTKAEEISLKELSRRKDPYQEISKKEGKPYYIKYLSDGAINSISLNQNWNAQFLMKNHKLLYEPLEKEFYRYDEKNGLWEWVSVDRIKRLLSVELGEYWEEFHSQKAHELLFWRGDRMLTSSISVLKGISEQEDAFAKKPGEYVIHLANGMLHLDKMQLQNFAPEYYSRNLIPYELDEDADCPRFLNELMYPALPEDDVDLLQRWAGSVLLGGNPTQQIMMVEGTAGGGKGTFAEVLETVIGHRNVAELRTNLLSERFELAAFVGKSLLCGRDVPGNFLQQRGADTIKKLVGHDYQEAEHKRANKRSGLFGKFAIMITSNNRLKVKLDGDVSAWRRRMMAVRYEQPPAAKRIVHFARKLIEAEAKGILLWMIAGAVKTMNEINEHGRIILNVRQQRLVDSLLCESDSLGMFVKERLEACRGWDISTEELKTAYVRFCEESGWSCQPGRNVERALPDLILSEFGRSKSNSLTREGKSARGFRGLKLKEVAHA